MHVKIGQFVSFIGFHGGSVTGFVALLPEEYNIAYLSRVFLSALTCGYSIRNEAASVLRRHMSP